MFVLVRWLTVCLLISMVMKPLFPLKVLRPADGGFCVSLGLGSGVIFTSVWFVCSLFHLPFNSLSCLIFLLIFCAVFLLNHKKKGRHIVEKSAFSSIERKRFLAGSILFVLLFLAAVWVKGFKPSIDFQTEQYMDYGFMNAMYRQQKLPFEDIWFAGKQINYYYFGQAVAVLFCRLAFVAPEYGYDLMLCTLFASLGTGVFVLVEAFLAGIYGMKPKCCVTGGIMASLMCALGSNGHWLIYGVIGQIRDNIMGIIPEKNYWFSDPTSFIGCEPDTLDRGKHEFPSYTLLLGDLHAHACNMLFTIPLLMFLFDYALDQPVRAGDIEGGDADDDIYAFFRDIFDRRLLILGLILGLFRGVNYWDFPIYYVVAGAVILFCDIKGKGFRIRTVANVLFKGLFVYLTGVLVMLPFSITYIRPDSGIHLCDRHSPPEKFIIIWFVHILIVMTLLIYIFVRGAVNRRNGSRVSLTTHELVIIAVSLCGLGLLFMPEIIYVKDIYGDSYQRFNTMFKLTYQGFILLSISAGIGIGMLLNVKVKEGGRAAVLLKTAGFIYCAAAILLSSYTLWAVKSWFGDVFELSERKGISAAAFIRDDPEFDNIRDAIEIINEDDDKQLHIIEEAGGSYSQGNRLSVFTGAVTVAGWFVHEYVWRNDADAVRERHGEVRYFYEGGDEVYCRMIIEKYGIDYIYVGPKTTEKYNVDYEGFKRLGTHVWESSDGRYMLVYIVQNT